MYKSPPLHWSRYSIAHCSAQRVLQAKADRLAKQLEEQHADLTSGTNDLQQQHIQQLLAVQIQLKEQKHLQASLCHQHCLAKSLALTPE
jgi:hypothetical protein